MGSEQVLGSEGERREPRGRGLPARSASFSPEPTASAPVLAGGGWASRGGPRLGLGRGGGGAVGQDWVPGSRGEKRGAWAAQAVRGAESGTLGCTWLPGGGGVASDLKSVGFLVNLK